MAGLELLVSSQIDGLARKFTKPLYHFGHPQTAWYGDDYRYQWLGRSFVFGVSLLPLFFASWTRLPLGAWILLCSQWGLSAGLEVNNYRRRQLGLSFPEDINGPNVVNIPVCFQVIKKFTIACIMIHVSIFTNFCFSLWAFSSFSPLEGLGLYYLLWLLIYVQQLRILWMGLMRTSAELNTIQGVFTASTQPTPPVFMTDVMADHEIDQISTPVTLEELCSEHTSLYNDDSQPVCVICQEEYSTPGPKDSEIVDLSSPSSDIPITITSTGVAADSDFTSDSDSDQQPPGNDNETAQTVIMPSCQACRAGHYPTMPVPVTNEAPNDIAEGVTTINNTTTTTTTTTTTDGTGNDSDSDSDSAQESQTIIRLPCHHHFHRYCFRRHFVRSRTCPSCRLILVPSTSSHTENEWIGNINMNITEDVNVNTDADANANVNSNDSTNDNTVNSDSPLPPTT